MKSIIKSNSFLTVLSTAILLLFSNVSHSATNPYKDASGKIVNGRANFYVGKGERGTSLKVPEKIIIELCGDIDGCEIRLGLHNWANKGKVASTHSLLYYNVNSRFWRTSKGAVVPGKPSQGGNANGKNETLVSSFACYFNDGRQIAFKEVGNDSADGSDNDFWLVSWNVDNNDKRTPKHKYFTNCIMTIID